MRYLSLFSGIEACSVAWKPLGWECAGVAEIEPFPSSVLAHHYPNVPNLGDVTKITDEATAALGRIDVVVGGSPCQDLSVAGKRAGLAGARSGLFHEQLRIFHAARTFCGARFLLWENVPGAFSSNGGADFAVVVGTMAGCDLDVPADGWGNEGLALGDAGLVEWAVLDAQWFGVAQRRRRVFVVLDAGNWSDRPPILLESDCLRGDSAPRRQSGEKPAGTLASRSGAGGGLGTDLDLDGGLVPALARCDTTGEGTRQDWETCTIIPTAEIIGCLNSAGGHAVPGNSVQDAMANQLIPMEVAHSLRGEGFDASEDGTGRGAPLVPIAFSCKDYAADAADDLSPTLRSMNHDGSHANGGGQVAVAFHHNAQACQLPGPTTDTSTSLTCSQQAAVAFFPAMAVRRLTPRECERLQGFPDDYTLIPWRKKAAGACPDGPRYKALGNSMAVPVMAWIGRQIEATCK